ncbi:MAG: TetR/AcrR family transcriptional regulator [Acidimicrobiales bacterium]
MTIQAERADVALAQRFIEAARGLMLEAGGPGFTVTQVVAGAGSSLKTFYRCFASKDELLVALYEDDARRGAEALAAMVARRAPEDRLRTAVVGLFGFITVDGRMPYAAAIMTEHLRLAQTRPAEVMAVMQPYIDLFEREVAAAAQAGTVRAGDAARDARMLFHVVRSHLHALICHQLDDDPARVADDLWSFCSAALRPDTSGDKSGSRGSRS